MAKILVADDAMFMRNRTSKLLTANGYEVVEAANGEEAVSCTSKKSLTWYSWISPCLRWTVSKP